MMEPIPNLPHSVPFDQLGVEEPVWFRQRGWMIALGLALPLGKYLPNVMELQVHLSSCFAMIGKAFASSAVCMLLELFEGYSIGDAFWEDHRRLSKLLLQS